MGYAGSRGDRKTPRPLKLVESGFYGIWQDIEGDDFIKIRPIQGSK